MSLILHPIQFIYRLIPHNDVCSLLIARINFEWLISQFFDEKRLEIYFHFNVCYIFIYFSENRFLFQSAILIYSLFDCLLTFFKLSQLSLLSSSIRPSKTQTDSARQIKNREETKKLHKQLKRTINRQNEAVIFKNYTERKKRLFCRKRFNQSISVSRKASKYLVSSQH